MLRKRLSIFVLALMGTVVVAGAGTAVACNYLFVTKWGSAGNGNGQFNDPVGIAVDSSSNVYVNDNGGVQKFDSSGNFLTRWGVDGEYAIEQGIPVAVSPDQYLYAVTNGGSGDRITKFDLNGNVVASFALAGDLATDTVGIGVDSGGTIYVATSTTANPKVWKLDQSGNVVGSWGSKGTGSGSFDGVKGLYVESSGTTYVTEQYRIQKFDSSGRLLDVLGGSFGEGDGQFEDLKSVGTNSGGSLFVPDPANFRIQRFSANGQFIRSWGSQGSGNGQFQYPQDVAVDSQQNVYVADTGNNRVQKFRLVTKSLNNFKKALNKANRKLKSYQSSLAKASPVKRSSLKRKITNQKKAIKKIKRDLKKTKLCMK